MKEVMNLRLEQTASELNLPGLPPVLRKIAQKIQDRFVNHFQAEPHEFPYLCVILGSGLSSWLEEFKRSKFESLVIPYEEIPGFPKTEIVDHPGELIITDIDGKGVIFLFGRTHYYEGASMEEIVRPVRALVLLGVRQFIITNAAGILNQKFKPGEFMILTDHINGMGDNPLRGKNWPSLGVRFPDMTQIYDRYLATVAEQVAGPLKLKMRQGVYLGVSGPNYETPAEIRAFMKMPADAVGMSTVPEAMALAHMRRYEMKGGHIHTRTMRIFGLSLLTNLGAGLSEKPLSHEEVTAIAKKSAGGFKKFLFEFIRAF